jgi:hypothetical protein
LSARSHSFEPRTGRTLDGVVSSALFERDEELARLDAAQDPLLAAVRERAAGDGLTVLAARSGGCVGYPSGVWQTASTLLPSGSCTNAP